LCGIVGVVADPDVVSNVTTMLVEGLRRLEYRGYDSAGFALIECTSRRLIVLKDQGRIEDVVKKYGVLNYCAVSGLAHTRWATHGAPSSVNAHPHTDCEGKIAIVHNGIIKNFATLREFLEERGHRFSSDTDTEVIAHLFEEFLSKGHAPFESFKKTIAMLEGAYAIALLYIGEPLRIYFARNVSPLIVGLGEGFNMVSSDIPSMLPYTRRVIVLRDGEYGYIEPYKLVIEKNGAAVSWKQRITLVTWSVEAAEKAGYPHFMLKEIMEQPRVLYETYQGLMSSNEVDEAARLIADADTVFVTGAGTSFHAGLLYAAYSALLERRPVYAFISSEYRLYERLANPGSVLIAISQSGETIDTLHAVRAFRKHGAKIVAVSNVVASTIPRESDKVIYTRAGPEIGVAATKTFLTQVLALTLLVSRTASAAGTLKDSEAKEIAEKLESAGRLAAAGLRSSLRMVERVVPVLKERHSMYVLSREIGVPLAYEGALKIKEVSYIHAEAYPAGESKHGPIALVEPGFPVIFIAASTADEYLERLQGNIMEMKARGAFTLLVAPATLRGGLQGVDVGFYVEGYDEIMAPYAVMPVLQLLAYKLAVALGRDPDKPRNLAKTVTVE